MSFKHNKKVVEKVRAKLREAEAICEDHGIGFVAALEKSDKTLIKYNTEGINERLGNAYDALDRDGHSPKASEGRKTMMTKTTTKGTMIQNAITTVKTEGSEALWRTAATQAVRAAYEPLMAALRRQNISGETLAAISFFLQSELGQGAVAMLLGTVLSNVPGKFGKSDKMIRLAKEMRILGMTVYSNTIADLFLDPIRGFFVDMLETLPEVAENAVQTAVAEQPHMDN